MDLKYFSHHEGRICLYDSHNKQLSGLWAITQVLWNYKFEAGKPSKCTLFLINIPAKNTPLDGWEYTRVRIQMDYDTANEQHDLFLFNYNGGVIALPYGFFDIRESRVLPKVEVTKIIPVAKG